MELVIILVGSEYDSSVLQRRYRERQGERRDTERI